MEKVSDILMGRERNCRTLWGSEFTTKRELWRRNVWLHPHYRIDTSNRWTNNVLPLDTGLLCWGLWYLHWPWLSLERSKSESRKQSKFPSTQSLFLLSMYDLNKVLDIYKNTYYKKIYYKNWWNDHFHREDWPGKKGALLLF